MKIIAEFCQNHNGNFDHLRKMINDAAEGGATHGKIQTIFVEDLTFRERFEDGEVDSNGIQTVIKRPYKPEHDRLKHLELSFKQHELFIKECNKAGIIPLTTAFTARNINELKSIGFDSIKVASYDCGSLPLIRKLACSFSELIISTGASFDSEIEVTANYLNSIGKDFTYLHCVTIYPTPLDQVHLSRMDFLKKFTPFVGLSEHTETRLDGVKASIGAIYLGANAIERHFTIPMEVTPRDEKVSIGKEHLKELKAFHNLSKIEQGNYIKEKIPEFSSMIGNSERVLSHAELLNRDYYRGRFAAHYGKKPLFNWYDL
jgi:N,N'-diacetyllegionaminate synthase